MIKHVIKFEYFTADTKVSKTHTTIIEFPSVTPIESAAVSIAIKAKLTEMHNLLVEKFPNMGFAIPRLNQILEVKIIN